MVEKITTLEVRERLGDYLLQSNCLNITLNQGVLRGNEQVKWLAE